MIFYHSLSWFSTCCRFLFGLFFEELQSGFRYWFHYSIKSRIRTDSEAKTLKVQWQILQAQWQKHKKKSLSSQKRVKILSVWEDPYYLEKINMILCFWKCLHLYVSPLQIIDLLQLTHCSSFLISDQPLHFRATFLNGAGVFSEDPLTVLRCCLCRVLLNTHTITQCL